MSSLDADSTTEAIKNTTAMIVSGIYDDLDTPNSSSNGDHINFKDATAVRDVHSQPKLLKPLQLIPISLFNGSAPTPPSPSSPPPSHQNLQHPPFPSDFQHDSPHLPTPTHSPQISISLPPTLPPKVFILASNIYFQVGEEHRIAVRQPPQVTDSGGDVRMRGSRGKDGGMGSEDEEFGEGHGFVCDMDHAVSPSAVNSFDLNGRNSGEK